ncbi:MAG: M24 family metallopeptidase [Gammaproteobacteria bacterium]
MKSDIPPRGFSLAEFEQRTARAQAMMATGKIDAVLLMTEPEVRYFSGFQSQFWESPTRPWFLIVPLTGKPVTIVPTIGAAGMSQTWLDDIRTWSAPNPHDDGLSLLGAALQELPARYGCIGVPMGHESQLRMPLADFLSLRQRLGNREISDARPLIRRLRVLKSEAEIDKIRCACEIASTAFENLPAEISAGMTEREIGRAFKLDMLRLGADSAPYVMVGSGHGSYDNIIMGPTDRVLGEGDVLIIDTGATFDGYFCDFDRNYAFSEPSDAARKAYEVVFESTEAGLAAAKPGATTSDVWAAMWKVLEAGGALGNDVGRMGHGLGMQLTEWPSNMPGDDTVLEPGMVMTLEPGMTFAPDQQMIHEEDIVIRDGDAELLTRRAWAEMPSI